MRIRVIIENTGIFRFIVGYKGVHRYCGYLGYRCRSSRFPCCKKDMGSIPFFITNLGDRVKTSIIICIKKKKMNLGDHKDFVRSVQKNRS